MTIDLDKLEQLHATATPGLWEWVPAFGPTAIYGSTAGPGEFVAEGVSPADTRFIVEARNQLPALITELREARIELSENEAVMNAIRRQRNKAELANERVRELHVEQLSRSLDADGNPDTFCDACGIGPFPCPTITALDGARD